MYSFPDDATIMRLVGSRLVTICCSANTVTFQFGNDDFIVSYLEFDYVRGLGMTESISIPLSSLSCFVLLDQAVTGVRTNVARDEMTLEFDQLGDLVLKSFEQYESHHLHLGGTRFIV
jgi:hypothetical protein